MQMHPNRTILEGRATKIRPASDGYGVTVDFRVSKKAEVEGYQDFSGIVEGETITLFKTTAAGLREGHDFKLMTSVLGGPNGQRMVIESVKATA